MEQFLGDEILYYQWYFYFRYLPLLIHIIMILDDIPIFNKALMIYWVDQQ